MNVYIGQNTKMNVYIGTKMNVHIGQNTKNERQNTTHERS